MAADFEAEAARRAAKRARTEQRLKALVKLQGSYRRLFNGEGSKDDADAVLDDLCAKAGFGKTVPLASEPVLREREARRGLVLHIFSRMDPKRQAEVADALRRKNDERS